MSEKPQINQSFETVRNPRVTDRIMEVAAKNKYIGFADSNHANLAIPQFLAQDETMAALARGGVKHIVLESFTIGLPLVFVDAFQKNEISKEQLNFLMKNYTGNAIEHGVDDKTKVDAYVDIIANAKKYGIKFHAVSESEGLVAPGNEQRIFESDFYTGRAMIDALKEMPYFDSLRDSEKSLMMNRVLKEHYAANPHLEALQIELAEQERNRLYTFLEEQQPGLVNKYKKVMAENDPEKIQTFLEKEFSPLSQAYQRKVIEDRLAADPEIAQRINRITGDDKTAILYGQGHFMRTKGDIDESLNGPTAVIGLHGIMETPYDMQKKFKTLDYIFKEGSKYEAADYNINLDMKTWQVGDERPIKVMMPGETAPPNAPPARDPEMDFTKKPSLDLGTP